MKFLDVRSYCICQVNIVYLRNFSAFGADGVRLARAKASFVFRCRSVLVVDYKVCLYQQRYGVIYRGSADPELFVLLEVSQQLLNLKTSVYRIDGIEDGVAFQSAPAPVLFQVLGEELFCGLCNPFVFHIAPIATKLPIFLQ